MVHLDYFIAAKKIQLNIWRTDSLLPCECWTTNSILLFRKDTDRLGVFLDSANATYTWFERTLTSECWSYAAPLGGWQFTHQ